MVLVITFIEPRKGEVQNRDLQAPAPRNLPKQPRPQAIAMQPQTLQSGVPVGPNQFEMD